VTRRIAVTITDHKNRGRRSREKSLAVREQKIVVRKLILPAIEEIPAI
jgi:hypothetical protein